jgi:DNA-binding MarR family transcriptional regulator
MALIDQHGALCAAEAGELLGMSRSQTSRHAHNLVSRGWARALQDPDDKRLVIYDLTRAGRNALDHDDRRLSMTT